MPKFIHIDISADDPERAAGFYNRVFGWTVNKLEGPVPYWLLSPSDKPGDIGAGIAKREQAWQSTTPTIEVASVDVYGDRIVAEGGTIINPKILIPGVGYLLSFKDPDGNVFAILEPGEDNRFAGQAG